MKKTLSLCLFLALAVSGGAAFAGEATPAQVEMQSVTIEAKVEAIDHATRMVTLKAAGGKSVTFKAGEQVKRLSEIKKGDTVVAEYYESLAMRILAPSEATAAGVAITEAAGRAPATEAPAGAIVSQVETVVEILAIDLAAQSVTIKGAAGNTETIKARHPENLKKVKVGDKVQIVYTEALAIGMEPKSDGKQ